MESEAGGHRIQRPSGKKGQIHSSTVTVCLVHDAPAPTWSREDVQSEWFSGTGAGGQHRNKHQNSLRLHHLPTGTVVTAQCRKRPQSMVQAWSELEQRLAAHYGAQEKETQDAHRREQVGTGAKADKRRTYRFQEGTVHDHITGKSAPIRRFLKGDLEGLWKR